jgi:predicted ATPase
LADVRRLLPNIRLLTLIGPGGTGKTRLSIQAAGEMLDQYSDGVWFVELASILDPQLVPRTTAIAFGLHDEPQRPVIDMLCDYLREKKTLIVLDNCEHLVDICARMADRILRVAPDTHILASSREGLGIAGEVTYRVPALKLPDVNHLPPFESLSQCEAVKLFIDRAMAAVPTFTVTNENTPALAQVCHNLDGIPLAIELAAAKIRVLSLEQIAERLNDRLKLLTGGSRTALERHQTLRAAIDWSFNLLSKEEQVLFRRLSVFVAGWTLEAAEDNARAFL